MCIVLFNVLENVTIIKLTLILWCECQYEYLNMNHYYFNLISIGLKKIIILTLRLNIQLHS